MKLVSLRCTQCGANLPEQPAAEIYQCSYCGSRFALPTPQPTPTPPPAPSPAPPKSAPARRSVGAGWFVSLLGWLPFAIGGVVAYRGLAPMYQGKLNGLRLGSPLRALWDRVGGPPVPVTIQGQEAVVGRMRLDDDQLYIVATDAATVRPLWKLGPLGTYSDGYQVTHFVIAGSSVVVTDARGTLRIYDLVSGQERKTVALRDRATNLCLAGPSTVAVAVLDNQHVALDTGSLTLSEAALPAGCDAHRSSFRRGDSREDSPRTRKPTARGFSVTDAHAEGELGVAAAVKSPGTPTPYALGFTPKTREIRWQQLLPTVDPLSVSATEHDALVAGRYLAIYGVGSAGWHLTALDAHDGARLWDTELRPLFAVDSIEALVVTAQFAYVNRTSSLDIYDAATGKLRGTVGSETYR